MRCRLIESPNLEDPEIDKMLDNAINNILNVENIYDERIKTDL